jgi:pyrimidine operon attenuation protein/uracil phosphoribosyltransferase
MQANFDSDDVRRFQNDIVQRVANSFDPLDDLVVIGIRTRGQTLADRLSQLLSKRGFDRLSRGVLDITLYRDDLSEIGPRPLVRPTQIDVDLTGRPVLLVDDVLFTGRTVRAALDALADLGRPKLIRLAVLVDRGGRELPIQADYVGLDVEDLPHDKVVKVKFTETDGVDGIAIENRSSGAA